VWPLREPFRISRRTEYDVPCVQVRLTDATGNAGRGEALGVDYDGETMDSMMQQITGVQDALTRGATRLELQKMLPAGGARNALDCAMWDLEAKQTGVPAWKRAQLPALASVETAFTIGIMDETELRKKVKHLTTYTILKVKTNFDLGLEPVRIVNQAVPHAQLIVDPNQSWTPVQLMSYQHELVGLNVVLVEQPLPVGGDDELLDLRLTVPTAADESFTDAASIATLKDKYDVLNIKLDKTGGLTEALACVQQAKTHGLKLMVGCMLGSSLSMAPGILIAQLCDFVDLDGPLLQSFDCDHPLTYNGSFVSAPTPALWG
jgi:L-Ala-D/L-Glu epimerase